MSKNVNSYIRPKWSEKNKNYLTGDAKAAIRELIRQIYDFEDDAPKKTGSKKC